MALRFIQLGSAFGFLSVLLGAFGAHALRGRVKAGLLTPERLDAFQTGVHYQAIHALALILFGVLLQQFALRSTWPGWAFTVGIVLFSGSLYALVLTDTPKFGMITPLGGLAFLAGWLGLLIATFRAQPPPLT